MTPCDNCGGVADIEIRSQLRPLTPLVEFKSFEMVQNVCFRCGQLMNELTKEVAKRRSEAP
jgi:bacterioferritin-associated ferredoxin